MDDWKSKYKKLKLEMLSDGILKIEFSNPASLNAIDRETHSEITYIWRDIDQAPEVRAIVVTGEGRAFSAGGDFGWIETMTQDHSVRANSWREAKDLVYNIINCSKPVISAINGPAAGAGLVVALLADISVASKTAKLVDGHTRLGVAAGDAAAIIWPLLCGMAKAKFYLLTCRPITGEEAERIGLVSVACDPEAVWQTAFDIAQELANGAAEAIGWTKYALNNWLRSAGPIFDASTALEFLGFAGREVREGVASYREKRAPDFNQFK
ncbi:enoyl-CoA hydratase/isomerase family protein (plasmid) [Agrobacterium tumefaciens]|uniref:enoyl-CoA hydratase/isomerase family protein n=1 Tax=Agrobacterium tumefaciens TaxID=358 RepID=UPI001573CB6B|nr:enoyl-CoA hydratase/isomerase family protein [Agrobacterium tumefaciens]NSZ87091.1 enoyl-CoA hydratase/isomerase family protein [Agrobacterium tumefaciens]WCA72631.1 enoyl-CoA hydratase/isomerase family protein [Agrobacterium tumefaciens]